MSGLSVILREGEFHLNSNYIRLNPLDLARFFTPNQFLELTVSNREEGSEKTRHITFTAQVISSEPDRLDLSIPELSPDSSPALFLSGRVVNMQTGLANRSYVFKSKIIAFNLAPKILTLEPPVIMTSRERRRNKRMPLTVPVTFRVLSFRDRQLDYLAEKIGKGSSQDLSCGGITMITELSLPVGLKLLLEFCIDDKLISVAGIVRWTKAMNKLNNDYAAGIKFLDYSPEFQKIISTVFDKSTDFFKGRILL
jgi:c-di-GMP-binding flagellar brake protein YcgR